jgi:hypothetical protein
MNNFHTFMLVFKLIFIALLFLVHFGMFFNEHSPAVIVSHYTLIILLCTYVVYISVPFNRKYIKFESEDFLFIILISLMLLKTIDMQKLKKNIKMLFVNIKNKRTQESQESQE